MTLTLSPADPLTVTCDKLRTLGEGSVVYQANYDSGVGLIEIRHPERHNALSGKMMVEFRDIILSLERIQETEDMVALIVTGCRGKSFCAGIDLVFAREYMHGLDEARETVNRLMHDTLTRLSQLPLITVASMAGPALGGGTELLTAFDYICMDSSTFIRFVQTRMGVTSPWGGARRLINRIGRTKALRILAGAPVIDVSSGKELGLVDKVMVSADKEDAYDQCLKGCLDFLAPFIFDPSTKERISPAAVRGMKSLIVKSDSGGDVDYEMRLFNNVVGYSNKL